MIGPFLFVLSVVLIVCALVASRRSRAARERAGLGRGRVIYSDLGAERRPTETLISWKYGLKGRPDLLLKDVDGSVVPVEFKTSRRPGSGRAYDGHVMQLACYCLLVEESMNERVRRGVVRYSDGDVPVNYTPQLRSRLLSILEEMRGLGGEQEVHHSHTQAGRCAACGFREVCDESLVERPV